MYKYNILSLFAFLRAQEKTFGLPYKPLEPVFGGFANRAFFGRAIAAAKIAAYLAAPYGKRKPRRNV